MKADVEGLQATGTDALAWVMDENRYPQASSFDPRTMIPSGLLAERVGVYELEFRMREWDPYSVLDIGTGKGFHLGYWEAARRVVGVELDPNSARMVRGMFPGALVLQADFATEPLDQSFDVVLALRCVHRMFYSQLGWGFVRKLAMVSHDRCLVETGFTDRNHKTDNVTIQGLADAALGRLSPWERETVPPYTEQDFLEEMGRFFTLEKVFPATYPGYFTYLFRRKLPPVKSVDLSILAGLGVQPASRIIIRATEGERLAGEWCKIEADYTFRPIQYLTVLQALGREGVVKAFLTTGAHKSGDPWNIVGMIQEDLGRQAGMLDDCCALYCRLLRLFGGIGWLPYDVVPDNVRERVPIDTHCLQPGRWGFDNAPYLNHWQAETLDRITGQSKYYTVEGREAARLKAERERLEQEKRKE
jgi:hypothetical protein